MDALVMILLCLVLGGWGVLSVVKPSLSWEIFERWKSYRADEPSDTYLLLTRIGGVVLAASAAVLLGIAIWSLCSAGEDPGPESFDPGDITVKAYDQYGQEIEVEEHPFASSGKE